MLTCILHVRPRAICLWTEGFPRGRDCPPQSRSWPTATQQSRTRKPPSHRRALSVSFTCDLWQLLISLLHSAKLQIPEFRTRLGKFSFSYRETYAQHLVWWVSPGLILVNCKEKQEQKQEISFTSRTTLWRCWSRVCSDILADAWISLQFLCIFVYIKWSLQWSNRMS